MQLHCMQRCLVLATEGVGDSLFDLARSLTVGLVAPPVRITLFVASGAGGVKMSAMVPHVLQFLGIMVAVLLLVTCVLAVSVKRLVECALVYATAAMEFCGVYHQSPVVIGCVDDMDIIAEYQQPPLPTHVSWLHAPFVDSYFVFRVSSDSW